MITLRSLLPLKVIILWKGWKSGMAHKVWVSCFYMPIHNCILSNIYIHFLWEYEINNGCKIISHLQWKAPPHLATPICSNTLAYYDNKISNEHFTAVFIWIDWFAYFSSVYLAIMNYRWVNYLYMYTWNWDKKVLRNVLMMKVCRNVFPEHSQGVTIYPFVTWVTFKLLSGCHCSRNVLRTQLMFKEICTRMSSCFSFSPELMASLMVFTSFRMAWASCSL